MKKIALFLFTLSLFFTFASSSKVRAEDSLSVSIDNVSATCNLYNSYGTPRIFVDYEIKGSLSAVSYRHLIFDLTDKSNKTKQCYYEIPKGRLSESFMGNFGISSLKCENGNDFNFAGARVKVHAEIIDNAVNPPVKAESKTETVTLPNCEPEPTPTPTPTPEPIEIKIVNQQMRYWNSEHDPLFDWTLQVNRKPTDTPWNLNIDTSCNGHADNHGGKFAWNSVEISDSLQLTFGNGVYREYIKNPQDSVKFTIKNNKGETIYSTNLTGPTCNSEPKIEPTPTPEPSPSPTPKVESTPTPTPTVVASGGVANSQDSESDNESDSDRNSNDDSDDSKSDENKDDSNDTTQESNPKTVLSNTVKK